MRKTMTAILGSLLLLSGVPMALTAGEKKDNKKSDKGQAPPVVIIIWEDVWTPIIR